MRKRVLNVTMGLAAVVVSAFAFFALQANTQASADFGNCGRDNDSNAVIRGGACDTGELASKYKSNSKTGVPELFKAFGVPTNFSSAVKGEVRKNGDVIVGGKVVASGAKTVGRHYMNGSTKRSYGGHTFYERSPSVSFASSSLKAFVYFNSHGEFQAAVLAACGNPVKAHPKPKPAYKCSALKAVAVDRTRFDLNVTTSQYRATPKSYTFNIYKDGKKVDTKTSASKTYRYTQGATGKYIVKATVTFSVTGQGNKTTAESAACSAPFEVKELPKVPVYACTGLKAIKVDRTHFTFTTSTAEQYATFKKVTYIIRNESGTEVDRFDATSKTSPYTRTQTGKYSVQAIPTFVVNGQEKTHVSDKCKANFEVTELPVAYECTNLAAVKVGRTGVQLTTTTAETNATFKKVTYVISNSAGAEIDRFEATTKSSNYTQANAGTYSVQAIPTFVVNGQDKTHISDKCKANFTVEEAPAFSCDNLSAELIGKLNYKYTLAYTAKNGATLKDVDFDFGDGQTKMGVLPADLGNVTNQYAKAGTYVTTANLHFNIGDDIENANCKVEVTSTPDVPPCEYNPELPPNHPDCKPPVCVYNPELPPESPLCKEPETPAPTEIPKTGPGEAISAIAGLGSLTAAGYYRHASRRELMGKFLGR